MDITISALAGFHTYVQMDTIKTRIMLIMSLEDTVRIIEAAKERALTGAQSFIDCLQYGYELAMSGKTIDEIETALKS